MTELNENGWHLPSVNEGLRIARVCNGHGTPHDMDLNDPHAYPTMDAYLAACRALHWRTEELRQAGIEPLDLHRQAQTYPDGVLPHSPGDFRFPITEAFPGDDHRQIYHAWRRHPRAVRSFGLVCFMLGLALGVVPWVLR